MNKLWIDRRSLAILVIPGLLFIIGVVFVPIIVSIYYSATDYDGVSYKFIGLSNYADLFSSDPVFWRALRNAVLLAGAYILLQHPIAIAFAILTTYAGRMEKALRIVLFVPAIISTFVTSQMWVSLFNVQYGLLNTTLERVGLSSWKHDWLGEPKIAIASIIFVCMWQGFGYAFLLYYAGVKGVPNEIKEAAVVDGATKWQYNVRILVPLLLPVIRIQVILAVVAGFKQMETVFLMTNGGPFNSTQFLSTYLYSKAFRDGMFGYANTISVMFVVFCLALTLIMNRLLKKDVGEY